MFWHRWIKGKRKAEQSGPQKERDRKTEQLYAELEVYLLNHWCTEERAESPEMAEDWLCEYEQMAEPQKKPEMFAAPSHPAPSQPAPMVMEAPLCPDMPRRESSAGTGRFSAEKKRERSLEELLSQMGETFSEMLLRLIDEKGYTDVEVYKRAGMDRKLFSKIRKNRDYHPGKQTVFALAVALRLSVDETADLLGKAGYSFSDSRKTDVIVRFFLEREIYNIMMIHEALCRFEEPLLDA